MNADMQYLKNVKPTQEQLHNYLTELGIKFTATYLSKSTHWKVPDKDTVISAHFDDNFGRFNWAREVRPEQLVEEYLSEEYKARFYQPAH